MYSLSKVRVCTQPRHQKKKITREGDTSTSSPSCSSSPPSSYHILEVISVLVHLSLHNNCAFGCENVEAKSSGKTGYFRRYKKKKLTKSSASSSVKSCHEMKSSLKRLGSAKIVVGTASSLLLQSNHRLAQTWHRTY